MSIVVIGAIFVDIKGFPIDTFIPRGRNAGRVETVHGGVCRNVVEDIACLEQSPVFVSLVDDTAQGRDILDQLQKHRVDTTYIRSVPDGTGTWLAVFDEKGDVFASVSKRPDLSALVETLDTYGDDIFSRADSVLLEVDMDREIVSRCFFYAEKYHIPVFTAVSNISIALENKEYIRRSACFFCNEDEATLMFGKDPGDDLPSLVRDHGLNSMIVTLGAKGCSYASSAGSFGTVPAQSVQVVDTTGAGDAFFAGASAGLTMGYDLEKACRLGTRLSAEVIQTTFSTCREKISL